MNDWNPLEKELRSWTPRSPSPKLKSRLFGPAVESPVGGSIALPGSARPLHWNWLAPCMALVCLGLFLAGQNHTMLPGFGSGSSGLFANAALEQPQLSTYYASARHSENNTPALGVEWTNAGFSMNPGPTNQLIH